MSSTQQNCDLSSAAADSATRPTPRLWFVTEIQQMMHGFGDCRKPLPETAALVEDIVYRQMVDILYKAEEVAQQRSSCNIGIEEFLFIMRRDKNKLRRLLQYLDFKDLKMAATKGVALDDCEPTEAAELRQRTNKRRKMCHDFLSTIEVSDELSSLLDDSSDDDVKQQRKLRAELLSRNMDTQQYLEYCEARQASFVPQYKTHKFRDWLLTGVTLDIKPNMFGLEVLSYLAYETVAQIVDLALLVKRDMQAVPGDPLSQHMAPVCDSRHMFMQPRGSQPATATANSPNSPETPGDMAETSAAATQHNTSSVSNRKRKSVAPQSWRRHLATTNAITACEVREAVRRFGHVVGPFAIFSKEPLVHVSRRHLAC